MACTSGCKTQDHASYGACLRANSPQVNLRATPRNSWDKELNDYASARAQGIQPMTTRTKDIRAALDVSDRTGVAFDAGAGGGFG